MKKKRKQLVRDISIFLGIVVGIIILSIVSLSWTLPSYGNGCLESFSEKYCSENNMTLDSYGDISFQCKGHTDERISRYKKTETFYYLSSEKESCLIKEQRSFKKIS